jgi:DnaK suppressor protein
MSTTTTAHETAARVANTSPRGSTKSLPPPPRLTGSQLRELESELRRELAVLERRLTNERADESARTSQFATPDATVASRGTSDTVVRHDAVTEALGRLGAGTYGTCSRCAAPVPFGRLLAMPEATHCVGCSGSP